MSYFDTMHSALYKYERNYPDKIRLVAVKMILRNFKSLFRKQNCKRTIVAARDDNKIHILFEIKEGIGGIIIALNYLKNFKEQIAPNVSIDIAVPNQFIKETKILLSGHDFIEHIYECKDDKYEGYDALIGLIRIPIIKYLNKDKRLFDKNKAFYEWAKKQQNFCAEHIEFLEGGTISDGLVSWLTLIQQQNRLSQADITKSLKFNDDFRIALTKEKDVLQKFGLKEDGYIILHSDVGISSRHKKLKTITRNWNNDNFEKLVNLLKKEYPGYKIVQVGYSDCQAIEGVDLCLLGKTNFFQMLVTIKSAKLLIACETGVVHFRHFTGGKKSVVLFGPTSPSMYGYPENINISAQVCNACEWMHNNWREFCFKSNSSISVCMETITPTMVMNRIKQEKVL